MARAPWPRRRRETSDFETHDGGLELDLRVSSFVAHWIGSCCSSVDVVKPLFVCICMPGFVAMPAGGDDAVYL